MTDILNIPAGSTAGHAASGIAPQQFDFKRYNDLLLIPKGQGFTSAERASIATFKKAVQDRTTCDDMTVRMIPISGICDIANSNTAPTEYTQGFGGKEIIGDGAYSTTLTFRDGGLMRHANLNEIDVNGYDIMLIDNMTKFLGRISGGLLCGYTGTFKALPYDLPDNGTPSLYKCQFNLTKPKELNTLGQIGFVDCDNTFVFSNEVPGIVGLTLDARVATAAASIKVGIKTTDSGVDMYDTYDDEFAAAGNFRIVQTSDYSTPVSISSVTKNAGKYWVIVTGAYTGEVAVYLKGPATLAAANIGGAPSLCYEAVDPLIVTMPAP